MVVTDGAFPHIPNQVARAGHGALKAPLVWRQAALRERQVENTSLANC